MPTAQSASPAWRSLLVALWLSLLFHGPAQAQSGATTIAQSLFGDLQRMVFQVRVIDVGSGDKYSLGSGFQVSDDGLIATNFHVISAFVAEPQKYRLEVLKNSGEKLPVTIRAIDVVHDLAVLHGDGLGKEFLRLGSAQLNKGVRIYSIGNPLDLGMTIIEGNYNGQVKRSRYRKILFSGSLNSGMSGGPAVRDNGEVIGVNVSKGGEQISFLVPASRLQALLDKARSTDNAATGADALHAQMREALLQDQQSFIDKLLEKPFATKQLGELTIPVDLHEALRCWGHSDAEPEQKYEAVHQHCRSDDNIFVADDLVIGGFQYDAEWVSTSELNRFQFYGLLQSRFKPPFLRGSQAKKHVTEYSCHTGFIEIDEATWKAASCFRAYKKLEGLFDGLMVMAMVEAGDKSAIVKIAASGFSRPSLLGLQRAVMESLQWNR